MKKFLYLSLTGLMVLSTTTRCMEQIIKADEEAQKDGSVQTIILESENALKVQGPQLPAKEDVIQAFLEAYVVVSTMGRYGVASSEPFAIMKESYATVKAINKGDKEKTRLELFDGYCSADEEYYEKGLDDEEKTAQKIKAIDSLVALRYQSKLNDNQKKHAALMQRKEELTKTIKELLNRKTAIQEKLREKEEEKSLLEKVNAMHHNSKEQENSLLRSRKEALTEEIKAIDERIAKHKEESNALLEGDVMQSVVADAIKDNSDVEAGLLEERKKRQTKLDSINSVIEKLEIPKTGWFGNWL